MGGWVIVRDFEDNMLSRFFQYGNMDWEVFYSCLTTAVFSPDSWAIFHYDENAPGKKGEICNPDRNKYPAPGTYILLKPDGEPIVVGLAAHSARTRHPTMSNTQTRAAAYRTRTRGRDPCCLISGLQVVDDDYARFKAAHVFPRAHTVEWIRKGFPSLITDPAPLSQVGGATKIDSIQNVILLRSDLHDAWDGYRFAVNPDRGYVVVPFVAGYDDIAGKILKLDHIQNPNHRPLDELFRDHFLQCVLKNMKGAAEPDWDHEEAFGDGSVDLSQEIWASAEGRDHLEFELRQRMHDLEVA